MPAIRHALAILPDLEDGSGLEWEHATGEVEEAGEVGVAGEDRAARLVTVTARAAAVTPGADAWTVLTGGGSSPAEARARVEALLRAKKLDGTLTSSAPWSRAEREGRVVSTGWPEIDRPLGGGFPRGECSEIVGARSTGRTTVLCALLASAAARGELVALVDPCDRFDPLSASELGVDLDRLLWVRGNAPEPPKSRCGEARLGRRRVGFAPVVPTEAHPSRSPATPG
jgi:hypothetical protein